MSCGDPICTAPYCPVSYFNCVNSLVDSCPPLSKRAEKHKKENEKAIEMLNQAYAKVEQQAAVPVEIQQRDYLLKRLDEVYNSVKEELRNEYFIDEPHGPATVGELRKALKEGKLKIDSDQYPDNYSVYDWTRFVSWREQPADNLGYKKALELLAAKKQEAKDDIWALDYYQGLEAVKDVENFLSK